MAGAGWAGAAVWTWRRLGAAVPILLCPQSWGQFRGAAISAEALRAQGRVWEEEGAREKVLNGFGQGPRVFF